MNATISHAPSSDRFITPHFKWFAPGSAPTFKVTELCCHDYSLAIDYYGELYATADVCLPLDKLIGTELQLSWIGQAGKAFCIHGLITHILRQSRDSEVKGDYGYRIQFRSPMHPLSLRLQQQIFINKTALEIVELLLKSAGITQSRFQIGVSKQYASLPYIVQFNETDLHFLQTLMHRFGLFSHWRQDPNGYCLEILDDMSQIPNNQVNLNYSKGAGMVTSASYITGISRVSEWLGEDTTQAKPFWSDYFIADTNANFLSPGQLISIADHPTKGFNRGYHIIRIDYTYSWCKPKLASDHLDNPSDFIWRSKLYLTPANKDFAGIEICQADISKPIAHCGLIIAKVEGASKQNLLPQLDASGCYRLRMSFDQTGHKYGYATKPISSLWTHGGYGLTDQTFDYGMYYPFQPGIDCLTVAVAGSINEPIIISCLPNPNTKSPVVMNNRTQHIFRSPLGHSLILDDQSGNRNVRLATVNDVGVLYLSAKSGHEISAITNQYGGIHCVADNKFDLYTGGDSYHISRQNYYHNVLGQYQLSVNGEGHTERASKAIDIYSQHNGYWLTNEGKIGFEAQRQLCIEAVANCQHTVNTGPLAISAQTGSIHAYAELTRVNGCGLSASIELKNGTAVFCVAGDGGVQIKGHEIIFQAGQINVRRDSRII